tara:strand:+ start:862 stop:1353 length:492 start_codon:yes stop_codon:yes gene_type:complete
MFVSLFTSMLTGGAGVAVAKDCTFNDLHGEFTVTADCEGLQDFSGIGQPLKRMWLAGSWGQLEIIEVPSPYQAADLDLVMETLARFWSNWRTPGPLSSMQLAGMEARVVTERKPRTTSRTWLFNLGGRNITARAVAYGKRSEREQNLEKIAEAFVKSFKHKAE